TGAAGDIGSHLRRELAGRYALRLSDIRPIRKLAEGEEFIRGDCANLRDMLRVTQGVAAVVHLGGFSVEGSWEVILRANILGTYNPRPMDKRRLSIWLSPRDLAQLVSLAIDRPGIRFEIVYGISGNKRRWYDNSNAERLGYRPQDDSETWAEEVLGNEKPGAD